MSASVLSVYQFPDEPAPRDLTASHKRTSAHFQMVQDYRAARDSWTENRENGEHMQMEDDEYAAKYKAPTLGQFMRR